MIEALAFAVLAAAAPAGAQDAPPAVEAVRACIEVAGRDPEAERACIGGQALACIDADPAAQTVPGMAACYAAETAAWDAVLAASYADLVALSASGEAGTSEAPADGEGLLRAAQHAWAGFRDADCAQAAGQWGEDAMREVAGAECLLGRTAARTLELIAKRRAFESP